MQGHSRNIADFRSRGGSECYLDSGRDENDGISHDSARGGAIGTTNQESNYLEDGSNHLKHDGTLKEIGAQHDRHDRRIHKRLSISQLECYSRSTCDRSVASDHERYSETASVYSAYSGYHSSGAASGCGCESPLSGRQTTERDYYSSRRFLPEKDGIQPTLFNSNSHKYHQSWHQSGDSSEYTADTYHLPCEEPDHDRRIIGEMSVATSFTGHSRFPHALNMNYLYSSTTSDAAKSDIATVCSGSVLDDNDLVSVTSGDLNAPGVEGGSYRGSSGRCLGNVIHGFDPGGGTLTSAISSGVTSRRNGPLAVEFALEKLGSTIVSSNLNRHSLRLASLCGNHSQTNRSDRGSTESAEDIPLLNDMGPPLSRVLLVNKKQRSSTGSANSVASSKGALSDGFVYGGGLIDDAASSVVAEIASVQSTEELSTAEYVYLTIREDSENNNNTIRKVGELDCSMELQMRAISLHMQKEMEVSQISEVASLKDMSQNSGAGRSISPGGTVYIGRGKRR